VQPEWQRAGLAKTLLLHLSNQLSGQGLTELWSGYRVGNEASKAWHEAVGFVVEPDFFTLGLEWAFQAHELEHRRLLGLLSHEEEEALRTEVSRLWNEKERLEEVFFERRKSRV